MMDTSALKQSLQQHFGFSEFKTGQVNVIGRLIEGRSTLAVFPTGGGKSLCYQLPALMLDGTTVVVSPLIALMKDQIDQLAAKGVSAVRLDSSLSFDEYRDAVGRVRNGEAKILYVAPERFFNERFRGELTGVDISLFAIDEAHCISQWGHNFRPDYLKLAGIAAKLNVGRVLCLTATATPQVQQDVCDAFNIARDDVVCTPFFRPNLHLRSKVLTAEARDSVLIDNLKNEPAGATIIYVTLQKTAEKVALLCAGAGLDARAYHAGMQADQRSEIQDWFMQGENRIVVATIAFGMGIDKSDIRYIYHYNPPKSIESYAQEIGRAGRDGEVSRCELLVVPEDRIVLENFVYGDTPSLPSIETFVREIAQQPDEFYVSPIKLSNLCDIRAIVTKTLLTYLELDGFLESTSPRYDSYRFKPNVTSQQLLSHFDGERQQFVRGLLSCSKKKSVWFSIDLDEAMQKLGCDRLRIVKALDYFSEKGWMELQVSGLVHGYRKLQPIENDQTLPMAGSDAPAENIQSITLPLGGSDAPAENTQSTTLPPGGSDASAAGEGALKSVALEASAQRKQSPTTLAEAYHQKVTDRERGEIERLGAVLSLAAANECQPAAMSGHFGQPLDQPCGKCSACLGEGPFEFSEPESQPLDTTTIQSVQQLAKEHSGALNTARAIARFLCGIRTPALTRAKLTSHTLFATCENTPFDQVIRQVNSEVKISSEPPF